MHHPPTTTQKLFGWLFAIDGWLIAGAILALVMANNVLQSGMLPWMNYENYYAFVHAVVIADTHFHVFGLDLHFGELHHGHWVITTHWLINDVGMAFFFLIVGKEVFESLLPGGALHGRKIFAPFFGMVGGMGLPIIVYIAIITWTGNFVEYAGGWAVPTATDIAFSALIRRRIFGANHPAFKFLLAVAVLDDIGGVLLIAIFFGEGSLSQYAWLFLSLAAVGVALICTYVLRVKNGAWFYFLLMIISWVGFVQSGVHPALGFMPVAFAMPWPRSHGVESGDALFEEDENRRDPLSVMEHELQGMVKIILGFFSFVNAGVVIGEIGVGTWAVLGGLILGKTLGIPLVTYIGMRLLPNQVKLDEKISFWMLFLIGGIAAIGFTVALFVAGLSYEAGLVQDALKLGALMSLGVFVFFLLLSFVPGIKQRELQAEPAE